MGDLSTRPKGLRRNFLLLLVALLAVLVWWFWPAGKNNNAGFGFGNQVTPVAVAVVESGSIDRGLTALGTITASETVVVRPRVEGTLLELNFADGQIIQKDQVLALIDPEPYAIALDQSLGQQMQNQAQLDLAKQDLARYEKLYKQDSIAKQLLDDARAKYLQLQGQAKIDESAVADARLNLSYTEIKAPISGRLGMAKVDVGNLVGPSDADGLVVITQDQPIDVLFSVTQSNLPNVLAKFNQAKTLDVNNSSTVANTADRQTMQVQLFNRDEIIATGELVAIDNQIDTATGTVQLKASFANLDRNLFPNQFVQVRLLLGTESGLVVPIRAIQMGSKGEYVYQLDADNKVLMTPVQTIVDDGINALVMSELQLGDRVVVQGTDRLRTGSKVEVIED